MTTLSTSNLEPDLLDELALVSNAWTSLGKPFADAFRWACESEAAANDGWIDPSNVRQLLLDHPDYKPRQLSALWSSSWLTKTDRPVPITGKGSRGNGNKSTWFRRLTSSP
jgi:hypothetical protein